MDQLSSTQKTYFAYTRVSTVKQGEGTSLQEQKEAIHRFCERNGFSVSQWWEEKETAAKRGRPVFTQMLQELQRQKVSGIILHKIDRGARNLKDWADLGELIDNGIEIRFAHDDFDLRSRGGRLSADIQAVVAADYIRNLREETRKGFYGRLKQGLYPLPAPIGYLDKGKGVKVPDPKRSPLVRKAFELYATGKYGINQLVIMMYDMGLRNKAGGRVVKTGIAHILHNPFFIGLIRISRTQELYKGNHKPLISKHLFDTVQDVLAGKHLGNSHRHEFLFRKLLTCQSCSYTLIAEIQKKHIYYRCHTKTCREKTIREEKVEEDILRALQPIKFTKIENEYLKKKIEKSDQETSILREAQMQSFLLLLNQIRDRLSKLTDAYLDGVLDKEIFLEKKNDLVMEEKEIKEKLTLLNTENEEAIARVKKFLELANSAYYSYSLATPGKKRDLVKIVTSNRSVSGKNVYFTLQYPFQIAANRRNTIDGDPQRTVPRTYLDKLFKNLYKHFMTEQSEFTELKP